MTTVHLDPSRSPRTTSEGFTLWLITRHDHGQSWRLWNGPRTVGAISRALSRLDAAGMHSWLEVETAACGPVAMTLDDLVDLGVLVEEHPVSVANQYFAAVERTSRRRRALGFVRSLLARAVR